MKTAIVYVHGKGGEATEADRFRPLFANCEVIGFDYRSGTPWDAKIEFPPFFDDLKKKFDRVVLLANSIGAYFSICSLTEEQIDRAFFISPVVDMKRLIEDMLAWANVTKEELRARGTVPTSFGETLSWDYYAYVCDHPTVWRVPTEILFGGRDALIPRETVESFAKSSGAGLTVLETGEHWFHTDEQLLFLDTWLKKHETGGL